MMTFKREQDALSPARRRIIYFLRRLFLFAAAVVDPIGAIHRDRPTQAEIHKIKRTAAVSHLIQSRGKQSVPGRCGARRPGKKWSPRRGINLRAPICQ